MYAITVMFDVLPEHTADFRAASLAHAARTLTEKGCLAFEVFQAPDNPARFFFYEAYVDQRAVEEEHNKQPYLAEFRRKTTPWILDHERRDWVGAAPV